MNHGFSAPPLYYSSVSDKLNSSIFEIWEEGGVFEDSITPAVHVSSYRTHILRQIVGHTPAGQGVFSLGCGNGFVEAMLVEAGFAVSAIDLHEHAVGLSRRRGVQAQQRDYYDLTRSDLEGIGCIYADGFIGHMYTEAEQIAPFIDHLELIADGAPIKCVISNDAPTDKAMEVQQHQAVPDFWYLSIDFLVNEFSRRGFGAIASQYYLYERPKSGIRRRSIVSFSM